MPPLQAIDPLAPRPAIIRSAECLDADAAYINAEHNAGQQAARKRLEHWLNSGRRLLEKRAEILDGKCRGRWGKWLDVHIRFTPQTARRYMRFAELVPEAKTVFASDELEELWESTRSAPPADDADADDIPTIPQEDPADEDEPETEGGEEEEAPADEPTIPLGPSPTRPKTKRRGGVSGDHNKPFRLYPSIRQAEQLKELLYLAAGELGTSNDTDTVIAALRRCVAPQAGVAEETQR